MNPYENCEDENGERILPEVENEDENGKYILDGATRSGKILPLNLRLVDIPTNDSLVRLKVERVRISFRSLKTTF
jgi:hypothetical protein